MVEKELKLAIIQKILNCDDDQVLQAVAAILDKLAASDHAPSGLQNEQLQEVLLRTSLSPSRAGTSDQDIADLQHSINEIFGTD